MIRYIKRPVVTEMLRWDGTNAGKIVEFLGVDYIGITEDRRIKLFAGKDIVYADVGDWVARDAIGGHYPIASAVHEASYVPEKTVRITTRESVCNGGDGQAYEVFINGEEVLSVHDGEPEDNSLCRNFSGVYNVLDIIRRAIEPGAVVTFGIEPPEEE